MREVSRSGSAVRISPGFTDLILKIYRVEHIKIGLEDNDYNLGKCTHTSNMPNFIPNKMSIIMEGFVDFSHQ